MPSKDQLEIALRGAHDAGDTAAATKIANALSKANKASEPKSNAVLGMARSLTEGLTLGWGDEVGIGLAAVAAKISGDDASIGDIYSDMKSSYEYRQGQFETEHPYLSTGAKVVGGLGTGIAGASKMLPSLAAGTAKRLGVYGATGAGFGAITGAGESDEGERIEGGIKSGILGGALGAGIPAIGMGASSLTKKVISHLPSRAKAVAGRQVASDITEAGLDEQTAVEALRQIGPKSTVADISDQTRARAESIAQLPGAGNIASKSYIGRNATAGDRVAKTIEGLNNGKIDLGEYVDDIILKTKEESSPLYKKVFDQFSVKNTPITMPTDTLRSRKPTSMILHNLKNNRLVKKAAESRHVDITKDRNMGLEEWDNIKKGLDDIGYGKTATNIMGRVEGDVRAARGMSKAVVDELDNLVKLNGGGTLYKDARQIYSSSAKSIEAAEQGAKFWTMTPQQIDRTLKAMPKSERDSFKLAGLQKLYDEALKTTEGGSAYVKIFNNSANKKKIRALLQDDDAFNALEGVLKSEQKMNITYKDLTQGSQTARKMAGIQEAGFDVGPASTAAMGHPMTAALQWASKKLKQLSIPPAQRQELADILMTPGPKAEAKLTEIMAGATIKEKDRRIIGQLISAQAGMAAGR